MILPTIFFLIALGMGAWLFRRAWDQSLGDRLSLALLPMVGVGVGGTLVHIMLAAPHRGWNSARLVPTFAIQYGYQLYYGPTEGPVLNHLYGPVSALAFLPATFTTSPTVAIMAGLLLNLVLFFGPAWALLLAGRSPDQRELRFRLLVCASFYFLSFVLLPLYFSGLVIHSDASALGLSLLACLLLYREARRPALIPWAALLLVLAVWAKQTFAPLVLVFPLYLAASGRRQSALRCASWLGVIGVVISAMFGLWFGVSAMRFNMFTLPLHHPWQAPDRLGLLVKEGATLLAYCLPGLALLMTATWYKGGKFRGWPWQGQSLVGLLLVVGAVLFPMALLSRVKVGGSHNNFALTLFFLLLAAGVALIQAYQAATARADLWTRQRLMLGTLALLLVLMGSQMPRLYLIASRWDALPQTTTGIAYHQTQAFPEEIYFPWNPLSTLLASGKLFHFEYGLFDRDLGGARLSDAHFWRYLPASTQFVAFHQQDQYGTVMSYLPGWQPVTLGGAFEGWTVYRRSPESD